MRLPEPGDMFEGKYRVHEVIGRGGFATVVRATHEEMGRVVALKVLSPNGDTYDTTRVRRFMREAKVLAGLQDPHNITMFDFGESADGLLFMVFEYVEGEELKDVLYRMRRIQPSAAVHILVQVLTALREAHRCGVLHRDIKPGNILVYAYSGDPFTVKLIDYGIAKPVDPNSTQITSAGRVVGTPRYMSPEHVFGDELSPASDLYSLGLVAVEVLTGEPAIRGASRAEIRARQAAQRPIDIPPDCCPPGLRRVLARMLDPDESARFQSADAVLSELRGLRAELRAWVPSAAPEADDAFPDIPSTPLLAPSAPTSERAYRRFAAVGGTAGFVVLVGLGLLWGQQPEPPVVRVRPTAITAAMVPPPYRGASTDGGSSRDDVANGASTGGDGCGKAAKSGEKSASFQALQPRSWLRVLPADYDPDHRYPVVLMFHRAVADASSMMAETKFGDVANDAGFVVLAPNAQHTSSPWGPDEVEFVRFMLRQADAELCLDMTRVYALGEASGGAFAVELACQMPLSALASTNHGEGVEDDPCVPNPAVPRLRLVGSNDPHVPIDGGAGCLSFGSEFRSSAASDEAWRDHHGCSGAARTWFGQASGRCQTWTCTQAPYVSCVTNGGHDWPLARGRRFEMPGCESVPVKEGFPNGETIWKFFAEAGRPIHGFP